MSLERRNGRTYYYTSRRIGTRVRKQYVAAGTAAVLIARLEIMDRDRKHFAAWEKRERRERRRKRFAKLRNAIARANRLAADALRASGWHQYKREWRKRRGATVTTDLSTLVATWTAGGLDEKAGTLAADASAKAAKGDRSTLAAVRQYLDNPAAVALWGDVGRTTLQRWVGMYARGDLLVEESMIRQAQAVRAGLLGATPTALDALLAKRIVLAWVVLTVAEGWHAKVFQSFIEKPPQQGTAADALLNFFSPHIEHAHRQLMAACRTLAKVRRAKLPEVFAPVNVNLPAEPA